MENYHVYIRIFWDRSYKLIGLDLGTVVESWEKGKLVEKNLWQVHMTDRSYDHMK